VAILAALTGPARANKLWTGLDILKAISDPAPSEPRAYVLGWMQAAGTLCNPTTPVFPTRRTMLLDFYAYLSDLSDERLGNRVEFLLVYWARDRDLVTADCWAAMLKAGRS
jgi:hypothetical protein